MLYRATHAEISLGNLCHNIDVIRSGLTEGTRYLAVVKANAYGHGMIDVSRAAVEHGADYLAVAIAEEGAALREAGIRVPILILGASLEPSIACIVENDLMPTVFSVDTLRLLQSYASDQNRIVSFHFKIDTGMNRIGFKTLDAFTEALDYLASSCSNLRFVGMFTHFAVSEIPDKSFTLLQAERFQKYVDVARLRGYHPIVHAANSGAALEVPSVQFDMVRGGIAMYGCHPAGHDVPGVDLRPVLSWKTGVVHVKDVPENEGVSYGLRFVTSRPTRLATLPVGYGDGYKRCMSGRASVLIHGKRAPQVGTVCMDQILCDVTDIPDVRPGDEAVLLGVQGSERITADEMAGWADTVSYEVLLSISERVPRVYL